MIPVTNPIPEPVEFDAQCRQKGNDWLRKNPEGRPKDFWSPFRLQLADGFHGRCGYGGIWISSGTTDHFVSCSQNRALAYEWSNYRYLEGWMNSAKGKIDSTKLLDPFEVTDGWFCLDLPSLQMSLTDKIPPEHRERAEYTLRRLPLRDDERVIRQRRAWLEMYEKGASLELIEEKAPLLACAIRAHNWPQQQKPLPDK